jgi:hypothetical protein
MTTLLTQAARLRSEVDALVALDLEAVDGYDGPRLHRELRATVDRLSAFTARVLARVEADGRWSAGGARTFGQWMSRTTHASPGQVQRQVVLGRGLDSLPTAAAALDEGGLSLEHVQALAEAAGSSPARAAALAGTDPAHNEAALVRRAGRMPANQFRTELRRWAAEVDSATFEAEHEAAIAKEYLTVARRRDGVALQGFLTHEHGEAVATALRAVAGVPAADDTRSREERQAGALVDGCRLVLDRGLSGAGQSVRPHLLVTVPWDTMQALAEAHPAPQELATTVGVDAAGALGAAAGTGLSESDRGEVARIAGRTLAGLSPAELADGEPIPHSALARIACDCELTRVVFGPEGEVLDVGRAQRTYTGQIRLGIIARDRSCRFPGCGAPPSLGEVHHVLSWLHLGPTSVENGILLCWHHHAMVHSRGILIARGGAGWTFRRSDGSPIRSTGGVPPDPAAPTEDRRGAAAQGEALAPAPAPWGGTPRAPDRPWKQLTLSG